MIITQNTSVNMEVASGHSVADLITVWDFCCSLEPPPGLGEKQRHAWLKGSLEILMSESPESEFASGLTPRVSPSSSPTRQALEQCDGLGFLQNSNPDYLGNSLFRNTSSPSEAGSYQKSEGCNSDDELTNEFPRHPSLLDVTATAGKKLQANARVRRNSFTENVQHPVAVGRRGRGLSLDFSSVPNFSPHKSPRNDLATGAFLSAGLHLPVSETLLSPCSVTSLSLPPPTVSDFERVWCIIIAMASIFFLVLLIRIGSTVIFLVLLFDRNSCMDKVVFSSS